MINKVGGSRRPRQRAARQGGRDDRQRRRRGRQRRHGRPGGELRDHASGAEVSGLAAGLSTALADLRVAPQLARAVDAGKEAAARREAELAEELRRSRRGARVTDEITLTLPRDRGLLRDRAPRARRSRRPARPDVRDARGPPARARERARAARTTTATSRHAAGRRATRSHARIGPFDRDAAARAARARDARRARASRRAARHRRRPGRDRRARRRRLDRADEERRRRRA